MHACVHVYLCVHVCVYIYIYIYRRMCAYNFMHVSVRKHVSFCSV